uniref:uncharacterized protein LOC105352397 n=1 Tax=Fragaria vesca subsp. vesca TaxID=101020 RepID=UPI0005CAF504|nr:PREDICTED: uncharacterized protein LOC105352397 [Fragaria vesca subsp. vesca]
MSSIHVPLNADTSTGTCATPTSPCVPTATHARLTFADNPATANADGTSDASHQDGDAIGTGSSSITIPNTIDTSADEILEGSVGTVPAYSGSNADETLQASETSGTGSSTSTLPAYPDTNADGTLQASETNGTGITNSTVPANDDTNGDGTFQGSEAIATGMSSSPVPAYADTSASTHATPTITSAEPAATYPRMYQQFLDDTTSTVRADTTSTVRADTTSADTSGTAASGSRASFPRVTRSWRTVALVALLALLFFSSDHGGLDTVVDEGIASAGVDYAVAYARQQARGYLHFIVDPILSWLPLRFVRQLPTGFLPPGQISRVPIQEIAALPIAYIAEQPLEIIAQLPSESVARLPTALIAQLPVSSIRQLHLSPTRWLGVRAHIWQSLLSSVSLSAVSYLPAWVPAPFTTLVLRFSLSAGSVWFFSFIIEQLLCHITGLLRRLHIRFRRHDRGP